MERNVIDEMLINLSNRTDHIHESVDIDSLDPPVAMGVGTQFSGGLTYREAHLIMEMIAERGGRIDMLGQTVARRLSEMPIIGQAPNAITRILAVLLAALTTQYIFAGIEEHFSKKTHHLTFFF